MANTNGKAQRIDRETAVREATYRAACYGWFDTSVKSQEAGALTISIMDMQGIEEPEPDATHKFYVMINQVGYFVTRRTSGSYDIEPHDQIENQRIERELRDAVMDTALFELGEFRPDPQPELREEARNAAITEMLEDVQPDIERYGGETIHAVIREIEPSIMVAPGDADSPAPLAVRQWRVNFGNLYTEIGFFGYDESNAPFLVSSEMAFDEDDQDEGDEYGEAADQEEKIINALRNLQPFAVTITPAISGYEWEYLDASGTAATFPDAVKAALDYAMMYLLYATPPTTSQEN